jgi:hypothetical protein
MRRIVVLVTLATLVIGAGHAFGHDYFRVIGIVTRYQDSTLDVKNRDGKTTSVRVDRQTKVTRDGEKVEAKELKAGLTVVVDAYGDTEDDLLALDIRIVPPIGSR